MADITPGDVTAFCERLRDAVARVPDLKLRLKQQNAVTAADEAEAQTILDLIADCIPDE